MRISFAVVLYCFDALTSDRPNPPRLEKDEAFRTWETGVGLKCTIRGGSTFIEAFDEIAPTATKAGQLAKSITVFDDREVAQARLANAVRASGSTRNALAEIRRSVVSADSLETALETVCAHQTGHTVKGMCDLRVSSETETLFDAPMLLGTHPSC